MSEVLRVPDEGRSCSSSMKMVVELPKHWKESRHIGDIEAWIKELKQLTRLKNLSNKNLSRRSNWGQWQYPIFCIFFECLLLTDGDFCVNFTCRTYIFSKNRATLITTSFTRYWLLLKVQIQYAIFFLQVIKIHKSWFVVEEWCCCCGCGCGCGCGCCCCCCCCCCCGGACEMKLEKTPSVCRFVFAHKQSLSWVLWDFSFNIQL